MQKNLQNRNTKIKNNGKSGRFNLWVNEEPESNYAMLGLKYIYKETDKLDIKVLVGSEEGDLCENTIAMQGDEVHWEIPKKYGEKILQTAVSYIESHRHGTGEIIFYMGAHGYYGSSQSVFGLAASILLSCQEQNCVSEPRFTEEIK